MGLTTQQILASIENGTTSLGIEFGSTRIKAVLTAEDNSPIASGSHDWENRLEDGIWTYTLEDIWTGLQDSYAKMAEDVKEKYGVVLKKTGAIGFSAMMHGYMVFDAEGTLLVPFRTWRNTITEEASEKLTKLLSYHIPQRWSIAHLYQAMLNGEEHVKNIAFQTTLAGYIHWKLTGEKVLGIGEASGMFPIDCEAKDWDEKRVKIFDEEAKKKGYSFTLHDIFPKVLVAGEQAGVLTEEGAKLLDPSGNLEAGIPLCPPEGDAGTGMAATNSVAKRTGNVSAGTSVFAMVVLEKELKKVVACGCDIIGINNRNLKTFDVDLNTTSKLAPLIPYEAVLVSESGMKDENDMKNVKEQGADAVLIGETFMRSDYIKETMKQLRSCL